ncbi:MAG: hypothetical protein D6735_10980 [Acidobacteria bacterium]|nr:MAG: hypothetical protein D6735_10980 [Acidobacteriota bacterium]
MPEFVQININVTKEDARMVDRMMFEDAYDNRSAFIRRLIRQEWARRHTSSQIPENQNESSHSV